MVIEGDRRVEMVCVCVCLVGGLRGWSDVTIEKKVVGECTDITFVVVL